MKKIDQSSIIICSIVRNAEKGLRRNIPVVQEFCKYFANYRVIVYEPKIRKQSQWQSQLQ